MSSNCCCSTAYESLLESDERRNLFFFHGFWGINLYFLRPCCTFSTNTYRKMNCTRRFNYVFLMIFGVIQIGFGSLRVETGRTGLPRDLIFTALVIRYCTRRSTTDNTLSHFTHFVDTVVCGPIK